MKAVKQRAKEALAWSVQALLGRRNTVRMARFLLDQARLDVPNDMASNGERLVQTQVLRLPGAPVVVFDVGAHEGEWTLSLLEAARQNGCDGLEVHAFEPSRSTHARLAEAVAALATPNRVKAVRLAMSDEPGPATLYKPHDGAGSSTLHPADPTGFLVEDVTRATVDEYARSHGIDRIRMLKCDAEGHDLAVLRGARDLLGAQRIDVVQFEYNHRWVPAGHFLRDAFVLFDGLGYVIGKVTPRGIETYRGWDPELETFREGNYVACPESVMASFPQVPWWKATPAP